jgi:hypothetical protein
VPGNDTACRKILQEQKFNFTGRKNLILQADKRKNELTSDKTFADTGEMVSENFTGAKI